MKHKRGKPVIHPKVKNVNTGKTYDTYTEAAADIGGDRSAVMRCCYKMQHTHKNCKFIFVEEK